MACDWDIYHRAGTGYSNHPGRIIAIARPPRIPNHI